MRKRIRSLASLASLSTSNFILPSFCDLDPHPLPKTLFFPTRLSSSLTHLYPSFPFNFCLSSHKTFLIPYLRKVEPPILCFWTLFDVYVFLKSPLVSRCAYLCKERCVPWSPTSSSSVLLPPVIPLLLPDFRNEVSASLHLSAFQERRGLRFCDSCEKRECGWGLCQEKKKIRSRGKDSTSTFEKSSKNGKVKLERK